jgi:cytochrome c oxidase subunit 2
MGSLDPQGPVAEAMADLWWLMLGLGVVVFVVFAVLLGVGLFRGRSAAEDEPPRAPRLFGRWFVVWGVALPSVLILVVFVATIQAMRAMPSAASSEALAVEIVGHQWWYEVRYPDEGITTANELHIPVGRPVALELTSADVIHSFWVPALGGKRDMLPDGTNTLILEADEPGEHRSLCAEFCGLQHTNMGLTVVAEPAEQFTAWVADQRRPAVEPTGAIAQRGQEVFVGSECISCHAVRGTAADAPGEAGVGSPGPSPPPGLSPVGPDLTHFASRPTLGAATLPNTTENLADWVSDPHTIKPGVEMPATDLTEEELDALLAYLDSLE